MRQHFNVGFRLILNLNTSDTWERGFCVLNFALNLLKNKFLEEYLRNGGDDLAKWIVMIE